MSFFHDLNLTSGVLWRIQKYSSELLDYLHIMQTAGEMLVPSVAGTYLNNLNFFIVPKNGLDSQSKFDLGGTDKDMHILVTHSRLLTCLNNCWRKVTYFRYLHKYELF